MKRTSVFIAIVIILIILFNTEISILTSYVSNLIPPTFRPFVWPLIGVSVLIIIALTLWQYSIQRNREYQPFSRDDQHRKQMLERVRYICIKQQLEHSLQDLPLINLGLDERQDAIATTRRTIVQQLDQPTRSLPHDTNISKIYNDADGELLILGEPGSGKTILLLQLTRDLLDRALLDEDYPIPVVFNLSSWAEKRQPLNNWLIKALHKDYGISPELGQAWIEAERLLVLLDGLDEVVAEDRVSCVRAINNYRHEHGLVRLVISCRSAEYLALPEYLELHYAVAVQLLTSEQIDAYIVSTGDQGVLRKILDKDAELQKLVTSPLMLSILARTYHGLSAEQLPENIPTTRQQVLANYIQSQLHSQKHSPYTPTQTTHWLNYIGKQMMKHKQSMFYIERMQPDWLPEGNLRQLYFVLFGPVGTGIVYGLLAGYLSRDLLHFIPIISLVTGILVGIGSWFFFSKYTDFEDLTIKPMERVSWSWKRVLRRWWNWILGSMLIGLFLGLVFGLILAGVLVWNGHLGTALIIILVAPFGYCIFFTLSWGPIGFFVALMRGLSGGMLDEQTFTRPNEGIRRSLQKCGMLGMLGVLGGLMWSLLSHFVSTTLSTQYHYSLVDDLLRGLGNGVFVGLILVVLNGGIELTKHYSLRLLLWRADCMPANYPRFLDYAAERILLSKVGGGYKFIHQILQDYFTTLKTSSPGKEKGNSEVTIINEAILGEGTYYVQRYIYRQSTSYFVFRKPYSSDEKFVVSPNAKQIEQLVKQSALGYLTLDESKRAAAIYLERHDKSHYMRDMEVKYNKETYLFEGMDYRNHQSITRYSLKEAIEDLIEGQLD